MLLVRHLNLSYLDLVVAVVALERCVIGSNEPRGLFCRHAMRRTFLGCCLIARKVNSDAPTARMAFTYTPPPRRFCSRGGA